MRRDALIIFLIEWRQEELILRGKQSKYRDQKFSKIILVPMSYIASLHRLKPYKNVARKWLNHYFFGETVKKNSFSKGCIFRLLTVRISGGVGPRGGGDFFNRFQTLSISFLAVPVRFRLRSPT